MVLAAAIEFGDKLVKRPSLGWARRISLRIPAHDPVRWNASGVSSTLQDAIEFLTGDYWTIRFVKRANAVISVSQGFLDLPTNTEAILAYSDGMDSCAVAGIIGAQLGEGLVRVQVGSKFPRSPGDNGKREAFTAVPYAVRSDMPNRETSMRSRGFKFALITGIAAYLTHAPKIVVPESGQGAIGPALVTVAHAYPDFRNHPLFTTRMETFLKALLGVQVQYTFPRLWHTKGETLQEFVSVTRNSVWKATRSCWRNNQRASLNGKLRQCGFCAACMLRRVSVHAAGFAEQPNVYICSDMNAATLGEAVDPAFRCLQAADREYAIAGVMHMDHMADMASEDARPVLRRHAGPLGQALGLSADDAEGRLADLFDRHAKEWKNYVNSLGARSFIRQWARCN